MKKFLAIILSVALIVMIFPMAVFAAGTTSAWSPLRGYTGAEGSLVSGTDGATLTGYGAVQYAKKFEITEGDSVSVTISGMQLTSGQANKIEIVFSNVKGSFLTMRSLTRETDSVLI